MNVGIIVVRKQWNNAPSFLIEGIKKGISQLLSEKFDFQEINYSFCRFTIHEPDKIHLDYEDVKNYDVLLFPVWIGNKILKCNLKELKDKGLKIVTYTGLSLYGKRPPFDYDLVTKEVFQGSISNNEWENLKCIDKFLVVKGLYPFPKEREVGCGQFEEWLNINKSKDNFLILDFCKKDWDEPIWKDFQEALPRIREKCNINIIQMGKYPFLMNECGVFDRSFVHYRRICKLYSKAKIFISMNESFGYPIIENKFAGNFILLHEKIDIPSFHISKYTPVWNKNNLHDKINEILENWSNKTSSEIKEDFMIKNQNFISWKQTVKNITHELLTI